MERPCHQVHAEADPLAYLRAIAFAPDGTSLLTAGDDSVARLYQVRRFATFDELLAFATGLGLEELRPEERAALFLAEP